MSVIAGAAVARWSRPDSLWALAIFVFLPLLFVAIGGVPGASALRIAIYVLEGPLGVMVGAGYMLARSRAVAHGT